MANVRREFWILRGAPYLPRSRQLTNQWVELAEKATDPEARWSEIGPKPRKRDPDGKLLTGSLISMAIEPEIAVQSDRECVFSALEAG